MKTDVLLDVAGLALRAAEAGLRRRRPPASKPPAKRAERVMRKALPAAEKALKRVTQRVVARVPPVKARRRRSRLSLIRTTALGAAFAGAAAYIVIKEQERVR